jgi:hypothetical protein
MPKLQPPLWVGSNRQAHHRTEQLERTPYDPELETGHVNFYFGKGDVLAALDSSRTYSRGPIESTGELTMGNFGIIAPGERAGLGPNGPSRVFRGLIDEVKVFDSALDLADIQQIQTGGAVPNVPATITRQPESQTMFPGQRATFDVGATGSAPILYQWQTNGVDLAGATGPTLTLSGTTRAHDGLAVQVRVSNVETTDLLSEIATLTVFDITEASLVLDGMVLRLDASALELADEAPVAFVPQQSGTLPPIEWSAVEGAVVEQDGQWTVTLEITSERQYFRLAR